MKLWFGIVYAVFLFAPGMKGQTKTLSGDEILRKCVQNLEGIEDYTVDLEAQINMERVRIPSMKAVMYFKAPDKIHFESSTFAMLPREGFAMPLRELAERYEATRRGDDRVMEKNTIKLFLVAKDPSARLQQLFAWVDPATMTIVKTETVPYRGRSSTVRFEYALLENRYWLPVTLEAQFTVAGGDTASGTEFQAPSAPQLEEFRRPPRSGSMSVRYSNYRINTGLSDEIFQRDMRERSQ